MQVSKIVDHRVRGRFTEYKVRWVGYGPVDDSWLPESELSCAKLIAAYKRSSKSKPDESYEVFIKWWVVKV